MVCYVHTGFILVHTPCCSSRVQNMWSWHWRVELSATSRKLWTSKVHFTWYLGIVGVAQYTSIFSALHFHRLQFYTFKFEFSPMLASHIVWFMKKVTIMPFAVYITVRWNRMFKVECYICRFCVNEIMWISHFEEILLCTFSVMLYILQPVTYSSCAMILLFCHITALQCQATGNRVLAGASKHSEWGHPWAQLVTSCLCCDEVHPSCLFHVVSLSSPRGKGRNQ